MTRFWLPLLAVLLITIQCIESASTFQGFEPPESALYEDDEETGNEIIHTEELTLHVNDDGEETDEQIEINYDEQYVKITSPSSEDGEIVLMIHDYTQNLTLLKNGTQCLLMDRYEDIPDTIEEWSDPDLDLASCTYETDDYEILQYKVIPFNLDRTDLPNVMRKECIEIKLMVLEDTLRGDLAYMEMGAIPKGGTTVQKFFYLPKAYDQIKGKRVKRGFFKKLFKKLVKVVKVAIAVVRAVRDVRDASRG